MNPTKTEAPVLAPFILTNSDGSITAGSDGSTGVWGDVWKYQVPQGTGIILQAGDEFSLFLSDDAVPTEVGRYDCYVKIEVRDPAEQDNVLAFGPALYNRVRELQDRNKIAKLAIAQPIKIYPRQWLAIVAKDVGTIDVSECYFVLKTSKVAIRLGT